MPANTDVKAFAPTASFHVESCRRIAEGQADFAIRILSGKIAVGDRFACLDGMSQHVRFHIRRIEVQGKLTMIECTGPITFDGQFSNFTVVTDPFPPRRPDLPTPASLPTPTDEESKHLGEWVDDWERYHPLQQAVLLCVYRGKNTYEKISEELSLDVADIESAFRGLNRIVLRDSSSGKIQFS